MTVKRWLVVLIVATCALRTVWAASLGPGNDEAYFLGYTDHLDWSYFDHPPMVAWLSWLGLRLTGGPGSILAMRWLLVGLFAGSTFLMFRITSRHFGEAAGLAAAFVLNATGYFSLAAGSFALPDGPLLFFWLAVIDSFTAALSAPYTSRARLGRWVILGLAWGGALLSKYHAILLPAGLGLFLIAEPTGRVWLRRPGPYLALAIGCAVFAPVIAWNLAHGWSSFRFQGGRAFSGFAGPRVDRLALAVAGQAAYTFPWVWGVLVAALASGFNRWCRGTSSIRERFFLWQSIVPLSAFLVVGSWQMLLPHWSLVGLIAVVPLAAERLVQLFAQNRRRAIVRVSTWGALPTLVGVIVLAHTHCGVLQREGRVLVHWLAPSRDPSLDLYGWGQVAQRMRERGLLEGAGNYLFTSKWYHSSQLAFALGQGDRVLCYSNRAPLGYADWTRPEQWVGRDGVLAVVNHSSTEPSAFDRWFERIEPLDTLTVYRAGAPVKVVTLYRCVNQLRPFPYIDGMHGDVAQPTEWPRQERASLTEPVRR